MTPPPELDHIVNKLVGMAHTNMRLFGHIAPVAILGPQPIMPIALDLETDKAKDFSAKAVRKIARKYHSEWALTITEAWYRHGEGERPTVKEILKLPKTEVVCFVLETKEDVWMAHSQIVTVNNKYRTFYSPVEFRNDGNWGGRFAKFLTD